MRTQYYYANFPTKLHHKNFKNKKDRNLHLLAMSIIVGWVNTNSGRLYLSSRKLADELDCSVKKAKEIIGNFVKWGFLKKISHAVNQHKKSVYELSTYNWNLETAKETATETAPNKEHQALEQNSETATETANFHQTNNDLTNNEKTNNEIKTNNEEKFESANVDFERNDKEVGETQPLETVLDGIDNENICPTNDELDMEINQLIAMYPKKSGNFRRLREKYWNLRLNHGMEFEQIKEAIENYRLEMEDQKIEGKYWKSLETLLDPVELDPFLYKPVLAIDNSGKRFTGEFCIGIGHLRIFVNGRVEGYFIDEKKFARMIEEERLIFCEKEELVHAA